MKNDVELMFLQSLILMSILCQSVISNVNWAIYLNDVKSQIMIVKIDVSLKRQSHMGSVILSFKHHSYINLSFNQSNVIQVTSY